MQLCKITQIYFNFIIITVLLLTVASCNVTKHLDNGEKLLVKNKIIIDKSELSKKDAGFEKYDIEQLIKPEPNSKSIFFGIPIKLMVYNLYTEKEISEKIKKKETKCLNRKTKRISALSKKIKHYETQKTVNPENHEQYNRKLIKLQNKKGKKEENTCKKQYWSKKLGEPAVTYKFSDKIQNKKRIKVFLKNKGYYTPILKIDTTKRINYFQEIFLPELQLFPKNNIVHTIYNNIFEKKNQVTFYISPGLVYKIDQINYNISDQSINNLIISDKINSLLKHENRLDIQTIENERKRISDRLRNFGYYDFSKDYIFFTIDTIGKDNQADITINISKITDNNGNIISHKKHIVKNVYIYPYFKPNKALINKKEYYKNQDTIIYYSKSNKLYRFIYKDIPRINPKAIVRGLYVQPENYFNLKEIKASYKYLASLPVIQTANINFNETNTLYNETDSVKYLNCEIKLTQDKLQSYDFSVESTHTSGNWGVAGFVKYTHNNFFRNMETFNLKLNYERKRITKNPNYPIPPPTGLFNSTTFGADISIKFPRLLLPLPLKEFIQRSNPKTIVNANFIYTDRPDYSWSIAGGAMHFSWNKAKTIKYSIGLAADFLKVFHHFDALILPKNYEDRFVLGFPMKFTFNNQLNRNRKNYFFITVYSKAAGNGLYKIMDLSKSEKIDNSYIVFGNAFAQFFKTDFDIRYYNKLNRVQDKLVFRLFMGTAMPYGNLNVIPFSEQYFSGGANGIRAWEERSLGPGSYSETSSETLPYYEQRADIKLEGNFEYRMKLFGKFEGALFLDAGNIWSVNREDQREGALFEFNNFYKEIAIGSGFGLRWDLDFLVLRVDLGLKVKDPALEEGNRWIPVNTIFKTNNMKINIGIGYPF